MKQLLGVMYVTEPDAKLSLHGECVLIRYPDLSSKMIPLHMLERIVSFSYMPISPKLMEECAKRGIGLAVVSQTGRIKFQVTGRVRGNVTLRFKQYATVMQDDARLNIARQILRNKIRSQIHLLRRYRQNHTDLPLDSLIQNEQFLKDQSYAAETAKTQSELLGIEGIASRRYFEGFESMIRSDTDFFRFQNRTRRPPENPCNAMLSYAYSLLEMECESALECAGLDPYVGFMHTIRSGKPSLALDIMEEFRPWFADRFVLRMINLRMVHQEMFEKSASGGIMLTESGRQKFLQEWNKLRQKEVFLLSEHLYTQQGILIHLQAQKMNRLLRGEESDYSAAEWR